MGVVVLRFTVGRDGRVISVVLVRGSGSGTLDQAAIAILRDARAPAFPPAMTQPETTVTVPIRYRLEAN